MLYIISGASRSGKSLVAKRFLKDQGIAYFPIDSLVMGFTHGLPEFGIADTLWPDEIARRLRPFLDAMCVNLISQKLDYVLEGEAVLPEQIHRLQREYPGQIRACFMGFDQAACDSKVEAVVNHPTSGNDWLAVKPKQRIQRHVRNMIGYSAMLRKECERYGLPYFETSEDFHGVLDEVMDYLVKG